MLLPQTRHQRDRVTLSRNRKPAAAEPLERRALLSGTMANPVSVGLLDGSRAFTDSVDSHTNPCDWRSVTLSASGILSASLTNLTANADLALVRDANHNGRVDSGELLAQSAHPGTAGESIVKPLPAGTYLVGVFAAAGAKTSYRLSLTADYAGNTLGTARNVGTLASSATVRDFVGASDPADFYRVTLASQQVLTASLSGLHSTTALQLIRDADHDGVAQQSEVLASAAGTSTASFNQTLAAGTYFVRVFPHGADTNYQLTFKVATPPPAGLHIVFDYRYDTTGFFASHPDARARLQEAACAFSRITDHLTAIQPTGGNTWSETFIDPATGKQDTVTNATVAADTIVIYVGGTSQLHTLELGEAEPGGWSATGSQDWLTTVESRGQSGALSPNPTDLGPWGGAISFSTLAHWNFSMALPQSNQNDFLSVATHEIAHVLGIGTSNSWFTYVNGHDFVGPHAEKTYGDAVPLFDSNDHWADNTFSTANGHPQAALMDPRLPVGQRRYLTALDIAGLQDIGWQFR